jgi:hypothetical protein
MTWPRPALPVLVLALLALTVSQAQTQQALVSEAPGQISQIGPRCQLSVGPGQSALQGPFLESVSGGPVPASLANAPPPGTALWVIHTAGPVKVPGSGLQAAAGTEKNMRVAFLAALSLVAALTITTRMLRPTAA